MSAFEKVTQVRPTYHATFITYLKPLLDVSLSLVMQSWVDVDDTTTPLMVLSVMYTICEERKPNT